MPPRMLNLGVLREVNDAAVELLGDGPQPSVRQLLARHLGTAPRVADMASDGALVRLRGQWVVAIRRGMSPERARFVGAHELGHWYWERRCGYRGPDIEARCDALAAVLVAPPHAVRVAVRDHGACIVRVAAALRTTQSLALLRIGEVLGEPVALLRKRRSTIIRGTVVPWPVPLSWQPAKRSRELVHVHITDEPWRFGVRMVS